jgi:arylsulfatase A-like enzyme
VRSLRALPIACAVAAILGGCGGDAARDARSNGVPGVVLVCLDTLRADAVASERMPALAAFAGRATSFVDASTTAPWTAPAVASMLTGLGSARHGVGASGVLPSSVETVASTLRTKGWSTVAVTGGGWVSPGILRGFEVASGSFDEVGPEESVRAWSAGRPADRPFFLFLHTYAAHDPYGDKRPGFLERDRRGVAAIEADVAHVLAAAKARGGSAPLDAAQVRRVADASRRDPAWLRVLLRDTPLEIRDAMAAQVNAWHDGGWRDDPEAGDVARRLREAYDGGLAWTDEVFSRTLAALEASGLPAGTAIVVVSDHGEAFAEHGALGHGTTLWDEVLRVPLFVSAPGRLAPGPVRGSCSVRDVGPTLLDLAGVAAPKGMDGRSLAPLARGESAGWPVVARTEGALPGRGAAAALSPRLASVRTEAAKYLLVRDARTRAILREELYDLVADPGEERPLAAEALDRFGAAFAEAAAHLRAETAFPPAILHQGAASH